jgi:hypothetical protein
VSISALRKDFLTQLRTLPSQRIPLTSKQALAEYQTELDRVDSMRNLDGKPGDLDPREGFVKFSHPGHSLSVPGEGWGCAVERTFADREKPVLEYSKTESLYLSPPPSGLLINDAGQPVEPSRPTLETTVLGENDRNTNTWSAKRLTEGPTGIRYEELSINYADPASSTKEVWLFNA